MSTNLDQIEKLRSSSTYQLKQREEMYDLQSNGKLCDMYLRCGDGPDIPVHTVILYTSSLYFKHTLDTIKEEAFSSESHETMIFDSISHKTLCYIVQFVYLGEILVPRAEVASILDAAVELQLKELILLCNEALKPTTDFSFIWSRPTITYCEDEDNMDDFEPTPHDVNVLVQVPEPCVEHFEGRNPFDINVMPPLVRQHTTCSQTDSSNPFGVYQSSPATHVSTAVTPFVQDHASYTSALTCDVFQTVSENPFKPLNTTDSQSTITTEINPCSVKTVAKDITPSANVTETTDNTHRLDIASWKTRTHTRENNEQECISAETSAIEIKLREGIGATKKRVDLLLTEVMELRNTVHRLDKKSMNHVDTIGEMNSRLTALEALSVRLEQNHDAFIKELRICSDQTCRLNHESKSCAAFRYTDLVKKSQMEKKIKEHDDLIQQLVLESEHRKSIQELDTESNTACTIS